MSLDPNACYRALEARDPRFDGVFFVGVQSTGIYCRPICPARTPGRKRCSFYRGSAQAERAGFRACLRCRPELAPGLAPVDSVPQLVRQAVAHIEAGYLNEHRVDDLAHTLGVSARHLRRATEQELGVSPIQLAQTKRLALAHQLILQTNLSLTTIAHASGFGSVRRFNAAFRRRFDRPPSATRRKGSARSPHEIRLKLGYRAPLPTKPLLRFLGPRAIPGVESVGDDGYARSIQRDGLTGWIAASLSTDGPYLELRVALALAPALPAIIADTRRMFDLDARPDLIDDHLRQDPRLRSCVERQPGLRVVGSFDGFEVAVRAILGQQVTVKGATTLSGRLVKRFGTEHATPCPGVCHLFPPASILADVSPEQLAGIGMPTTRAAAITTLARAVASHDIDLSANAPPAQTIDALCRLPGIGPWTAHYVAMRALDWPDAFMASDLGVRKALGGLTPSKATRQAAPWSPWRAYAVMHLWESLKETS